MHTNYCCSWQKQWFVEVSFDRRADKSTSLQLILQIVDNPFMQMPVLVQFILRFKLQQHYDVWKKIQRQEKFFVMYLTLGSLVHFSITQLPGERTVLQKWFKQGSWGKNDTTYNCFRGMFQKTEGEVFDHVTNMFLETVNIVYKLQKDSS